MPAHNAAVVAGLREWARGIYSLEAGAELLIRAFGGRFARPGCPWIQPAKSGGYWVDTDTLIAHAGVLSGGEQRLLCIVAALLDARPLADLGGTLAGLDREGLHLVLAALAHAGGSHQQVDLVRRGDRMVTQPLACLVDWPPVQGAPS